MKHNHPTPENPLVRRDVAPLDDPDELDLLADAIARELVPEPVHGWSTCEEITLRERVLKYLRPYMDSITIEWDELAQAMESERRRA